MRMEGIMEIFFEIWLWQLIQEFQNSLQINRKLKVIILPYNNSKELCSSCKKISPSLIKRGYKELLNRYEQGKNFYLESKPFQNLGILTDTWKMQRLVSQKNYQASIYMRKLQIDIFQRNINIWLLLQQRYWINKCIMYTNPDQYESLKYIFLIWSKTLSKFLRIFYFFEQKKIQIIVAVIKFYCQFILLIQNKQKVSLDNSKNERFSHIQMNCYFFNRDFFSKNHEKSESDSDDNSNSDTNDFDITQLEQSVLISKDDGQQKFIKGSDQYDYKYFLNILNQKGYQVNLIHDNLKNEPMQTEEITKRQKEISQKMNKKLFEINFETYPKIHLQIQRQFQIQLSKNANQYQYSNKLSIHDYLEDAYTEKGINKLSPDLLHQLNLLELIKSPNKLNEKKKQTLLSQTLALASQLLSKWKKQENQIRNFLTIFVGNLFFKQFGDIEKQKEDPSTKLEKSKEIIQNLNEAYIWTKQQSEKFNPLRQIVLRGLLQYGKQ
ncbi:unnamed protein product [Paramecium octaurelia]|uniref:Uncharacterized protein n=1 Tax=Paramecium octaurelia TaxID=43137 RepID=A0A8S1WBB8_PAROT|nr:unnamed protein product [Paramecium octaurelia]